MEGLVKHKWGTKEEYRNCEKNQNHLYFVCDFNNSDESINKKYCELFAGEYQVVGPNNFGYSGEQYNKYLHDDMWFEPYQGGQESWYNSNSVVSIYPEDYVCGYGKYFVNATVNLDLFDAMDTIVFEGCMLGLFHDGLKNAVSIRNIDRSNFDICGIVDINETTYYFPIVIALFFEENSFNSYNETPPAIKVACEDFGFNKSTRITITKIGDDDGQRITPPTPQSNQIFYYTLDSASGLYTDDFITYNEQGPFLANLVSHEFDGDKWILTFDRPLTEVDGRFEGDHGMKSVFLGNVYRIVLPDTISVFGDGAFKECDYLVDLNMPESLTEINSNVFGGCPFSKIEIPSSVTYIGEDAFECCRLLTEVTLPNGIPEIGDGFFGDA